MHDGVKCGEAAFYGMHSNGAIALKRAIWRPETVFVDPARAVRATISGEECDHEARRASGQHFLSCQGCAYV